MKIVQAPYSVYPDYIKNSRYDSQLALRAIPDYELLSKYSTICWGGNGSIVAMLLRSSFHHYAFLQELGNWNQNYTLMILLD